MTKTYNVNLDRIENDLFDLKKFGYCQKDKGIYRQGLTQTDMDARHWLMEQFKKQGLTTCMDGAANIIGRFGDSDGPAIVIGSHLDAAPCGGMFDGTLGVIAGLECVRVIIEQQIGVQHPIEIVATSEEEGRFGGMFGSQSLTGHLTADWIEKACSVEGESLKETMQKLGLNPKDALNERYSRDSIIAFLELHIEQGPVLENKEKSIGIVENISGVFKWLVKLIGKAGHAGTAPMDMRSDAFMGLADFAHELSRIIDEEGSDKSRLTIGQVDLKPGSAHTIPGEAHFTLVGRDVDEEIMRNLSAGCRKVLSAIARKHRLMFEFEEKSWLPPQPCSPEIVSILEETVRKMEFEYMLMPSGAGHDTQFFAKITPSSMIFVPSVNGISHAPDEWTHWTDVEKGANVLLNSLLKIDSL